MKMIINTKPYMVKIYPCVYVSVGVCMYVYTETPGEQRRPKKTA